MFSGEPLGRVGAHRWLNWTLPWITGRSLADRSLCWRVGTYYLTSPHSVYCTTIFLNLSASACRGPWTIDAWILRGFLSWIAGSSTDLWSSERNDTSMISYSHRRDMKAPKCTCWPSFFQSLGWLVSTFPDMLLCSPMESSSVGGLAHEPRISLVGCNHILAGT